MVRSQFTDDGRIMHWSDEGYYIRQTETDILYINAVDVLPCRYTYEETDKLIPESENEEA